MEKLTVKELKQILKEKGLKTSGKKQDLIQRLNPTPCKESYLDYLPKDILNMVDSYLKENNRRIVEAILNAQPICLYMLGGINKDKLIEGLNKRGVKIEIIENKFRVLRIESLSDEKMFELLRYLLRSVRAHLILVNTTLKEYGASFRILKYGKIRQGRTDIVSYYEMEYVK